jgi:hypothetical protein
MIVFVEVILRAKIYFLHTDKFILESFLSVKCFIFSM